MAYRVLYMSGDWVIVLGFPSQQRYRVWEESVRRIKLFIEAINNDDNDDAGRVPCYNAWLSLVASFVSFWGEDLLPPDIKHAVNSVEDGIGVQRTVWGDSPANYLVGAGITA